MNSKKRIAVVAGGFSEESVISLKSSETIMRGLNTALFEPFLVKILDENWTVSLNDQEISIDKSGFSFELNGETRYFDFAFIMIHGTPGEDGMLQAYLELLNIPYSTGDSAQMGLTFDKAYTQSTLKGLGYSVAKNRIIHFGDHVDAHGICDEIGLPCFVKPSRAGSSLGVSKVKDVGDLNGALESAFQEFRTALVESFLDGVEITCGVYRVKGEVRALPVTEIVSQNEFFDYEAKYHDIGTQEITPARIDQSNIKKCQELSREIYHRMECQGIVRIDYMLVEGELFIIELNTVPGMSSESIIPKQLASAQIELTSFLSDLIAEKLTLDTRVLN